eukprot:GEMP01059995.1.p1 GENE.GEMP01059995.1~~GEMP01059995.1.p1  ORF type:complete len:412 (+),score=47.01 GEMP01059995.1:28-1263(+)
MEEYRSLPGWKTEAKLTNSDSTSSESDTHVERLVNVIEDGTGPRGSCDVPDTEARRKKWKDKRGSRSEVDEYAALSESSKSLSEEQDPGVARTLKIIKAARCKIKALKEEKREKRRIFKEQQRLEKLAADEMEESLSDPLDAQFWFYDMKKSEWGSSPQRVRIASKPFARGGMRWALKMYLQKEDGSEELWVAKVFLAPHHSREYFSEALTQVVCENYAESFRQLVFRGAEEEECTFRFLPVYIMKLSQNYFSMKKHPYGELYCVEPFLSGTYEKFSDNMGRIYETSGTWSETQLPHAFTHYTYEQSGHLLCVTDLQGVKTWFTDPQIHTVDGCGFGRGNMAEEGIDKFRQTHVCTDICKALKLRALDESSDDEEVRKKRDATNTKHTTAFMDKSGQIVLQSWTQSSYDNK